MSSDRCHRCDNQLLANARFCSKCAFPSAFEPSVGTTGSEWVASPHEFAVRIRPEQVKAWFNKGVNVDESQTGLLFESGRFEHELTAGRQKLESLPDRIRKYVTGATMSAVLMRRGLFPLSVLGTALTPAGDEVSFECELGLQLGDRNTFYVNLMQSTEQVTSGDLMQRFAGVVRQALFSVIATCSSSELLNVHPELQQRMVNAVADAVGPIATRWGMAIGYVSPPAFSNQQLAQFQLERAKMVRELRSEKLQQQFAEQKQQIEIRHFQTARVLADAKVNDAIESAERTSEFDKVKAELHHSQQLHGLQLDESMDAAVDSFAARQRDRQETNEDAASLRAHLLAATDIQRQSELAELTFEFRKQSLSQQHELDDLTREQQTKAARDELQAELERLDTTQTGQIDRWRRQRSVQREDRLVETEVKAKTTQIEGDSQRDKSSKDYDEGLRQRQGSHGQTVKEKEDATRLEVEKLGQLSGVQANHLGRLQDVQKKELENSAYSERASHELAQESKDLQHKHKLEELQLMKDSPEMMQLLKMAELAVQSPAMSAAFGDVMKMAMAKGMTREQLEPVMAAQSPEVAKALQEKFRAEAAANANTVEVERAAFERLITELKSAQQLSADQMKDFVTRLETMGIRTHEVLGEVGIAAGSRGDQSAGNVENEQLKELTKKLEKLSRRLNKQKNDGQS